MPKIALITGVAGFVGAAVAERLLTEGWQVVGLDNLNDYYTPVLKEARLAHIRRHPAGKNFSFHKLDLIDRDAVIALAVVSKPSVVIHLAAQASVRYGLVNQVSYLESNLIGHFNMLSATKALADSGHPVRHFLYASSSSVYGNNESTMEDGAFSEADNVDKPVSLYAATKRANELVTHAWSHQFGLPATGLRFFTVYGPWGRPDMTPVMFTRAIAEGKPIPLFNKGDLWRDFTYIDDIVEAVFRLMSVIPEAHPTPHTFYNLGNQTPVQMLTFVETLGKVLGKTPVLDMQGWPSTEVYKTHADTSRLKQAVGWAPATPLTTGLSRLAEWYTATGHSVLAKA